MKVSNSTKVINNRTVKGLELLALENQNAEYLTTAWLVNLFNRWFHLMTNRSGKMALSKKNNTLYEESIGHIKKTARVFQLMSVGAKGDWKPVQTGVVLSSYAMLFLQDYFLNTLMFVFLLTGRFTQDFLENLFSCIRFWQSVPHALAFKENLKVITLAQYSEASVKCSYQQDDGELADFLTYTKVKAGIRKQEASASVNTYHIQVPHLPDDSVRRAFSDWELLVLYDIAGAVLHSVKKVFPTCGTCFGELLWREKERHPYATLTLMNQYKPGATLEVSDECFMVLCKAELTFRIVRDTLREAQVDNIFKFLVNKVHYLWEASPVPTCHNIWKNYLRHYFNMRYRMYGQKRRADLNKEKQCHKNSKSTAMHKNTK